MRPKSFLLVGVLLIASVFAMQAQNALPDPHNDTAWQSLESLRAWQVEQYARELNYEQSCTSYPEYQCNPSTTDTNVNAESVETALKKQTNSPTANASSKASDPSSTSTSNASSK